MIHEKLKQFENTLRGQMDFLDVDRFVLLAEESKDKAYVEGLAYHIWLELQMEVLYRLKVPVAASVHISKEVAKALLDSKSKLCDHLYCSSHDESRVRSFFHAKVEYGNDWKRWAFCRSGFFLNLGMTKGY